MYIKFDEYPPCSGIISGIFETNVNENIQCVHGYAYSSGKQKMCTLVNADSLEMIKNCFPHVKPINFFPKTVLCKECTYVQKDINGKDEKIDPTEDIEQNVFSSYFIENLFLLWKLLKQG